MSNFDEKFQKSWMLQGYRVLVAVGVVVGPFAANSFFKNSIREEMDKVQREYLSIDRYQREHTDVISRIVVIERTVEQKVDRVVAEQREVNRETRQTLTKVQEQLYELDTKLAIIAALDRKIDAINRVNTPAIKPTTKP